MKKIIRRTAQALLVLLVLLLAIVYLRHGGGKMFRDLSGTPILGAADLEVYFQSDEPVGNVAASRDTTQPVRVFITIHPESRPENHKVLEITGGVAKPYPDATAQKTLFNTVLGLYTDNQNRLWSIDHGNHGSAPVRLLAFDLTTDRIVHDYTFPKEVAEKGSFFNDLCVTPDGKFVLIADVSFWRKKPSLIVYDVENKRSRSLLDGHPSVENQGYVPVTPAKKMRFFGGLADLMPGIDGLDVDPLGQYVYWAAMSHDGLFRLPLITAIDFNLDPQAIAGKVERVADKPLSDGIRVDKEGTVLITDVEHQGVHAIAPDGKNYTLIKDTRIRWADGLSLGGDGYWYLADSDIPDQMLQSKKHMQAHKPYFVFRFKMPAHQTN